MVIVTQSESIRLTMLGQQVVYRPNEENAALYGGRIVGYDPKTKRADIEVILEGGAMTVHSGISYDQLLEAPHGWCHLSDIKVRLDKATGSGSGGEEKRSAQEGSSAPAGKRGEQPRQLPDPVGVSGSDGSAKADQPSPAAKS